MEWSANVAEIMGVPQEPSEVSQPDPISLSTVAPSPKLPTLQLSNASCRSWDDARQHRSVRAQNLLAPSVRKGYRLTKDDWAYLGAVRRPDPLLSYLTSAAKPSSKGVQTLTGHKNLVSYVGHLQDTIQASAHTMRPLSHAISGLFSIQKCALAARDAVGRGDGDTILKLLDQVDGLCCFSWAAAEDVADCLARSNSDMARKLRELWVDQADLPANIRDAIKQVPIERGHIPPEKNVEFSAPICGEQLPKLYDEAYQRSKASQSLHRKQSQFKAPQIKRKNSKQGGFAAKKAKRASVQQGSQGGQQQGQASFSQKSSRWRSNRRQKSSTNRRGGGGGTKGSQPKQSS